MLPMGMALFILTLLVSFNKTMNRLTKPVSFLVVFSLLSSALLSTYLFFKKIEGEVFLSNYLGIFENKNLVLHLNSLTEKITIFFTVIMAAIVVVLCYKLPREKGYASMLIAISFVSSSIILAIMFLDFSVLI